MVNTISGFVGVIQQKESPGLIKIKPVEGKLPS